ncbi:MAG: DUF1566 domain-containing protein [Candidatus Erginobacter occultus]|nr:DUF1566 domain-containing protein [Candidatus Erginobacter occultus]
MKLWTIGGAFLLATAWTAGIFAVDFNGDGTQDITIFRPGSGLWAVRGVTRVYFGASGDAPVAGDYDGLGTAVPAVFRAGSGLWAARGVTRAYFGSFSDIPVPLQFNPSSACRIGIFRESSGLWAVREKTRFYFGGMGDTPVPGDYDGDGEIDFAIFRSSSGLWAVRGVTRAYFGSTSDISIPPGRRAGIGVLWTGQSGIYQDYDDGYYRSGRTFSYQTAIPARSKPDEVVTLDNVTGLMWASDGAGKGCNYGQSLTWSAAVSWADRLDFAGYRDWRLPNLRELLSLMNYGYWKYGNSTPAINLDYFPNTRFAGVDLYWSSTSRFYYEEYIAWYVSFSSGYIDAKPNNKSTPHYVRAVRGGK